MRKIPAFTYHKPNTYTVIRAFVASYIYETKLKYVIYEIIKNLHKLRKNCPLFFSPCEFSTWIRIYEAIKRITIYTPCRFATIAKYDEKIKTNVYL